MYSNSDIYFCLEWRPVSKLQPSETVWDHCCVKVDRPRDYASVAACHLIGCCVISCIFDCQCKWPIWSKWPRSRVSMPEVACSCAHILMSGPLMCDLTMSGTVVNNTNNNTFSPAYGAPPHRWFVLKELCWNVRICPAPENCSVYEYDNHMFSYDFLVYEYNFYICQKRKYSEWY